MNIELINTGTELLLGRVLNTHQQWLCRQLAGFGYRVTRQVSVADTAPAIQVAVREALSHADLVITTGGLGPTADDLTRELIAELLGRKLQEDVATLAHIEKFFALRQRPLPAMARRQALVPEGALVLPNPHGTAPGLAIEARPNPFRPGGAPGWLIMLPGPPRELRPMFVNSVVPLLRDTFPLDAVFVCRTIRTTGLGESFVQERIAPPLEQLVSDGLELGYCARTGQVDLRLTARGPTAEQLVREAENLIQERVGPYIFGYDDDELEAVVLRLLTERKQTVALAESCTGGCIAHRLTNIPGASAAFLAGLVTYSNAAKQKFLGVRAETLDQHGAVSEATAREMAEGARQRTGADYALAVTGIAGPTGGAPDKPVGTVFMALAGAFSTVAERQFNPYDRVTFKEVTAQQALDLMRRAVLKGGAL